jgi:hypothetical protein
LPHYFRIGLAQPIQGLFCWSHWLAAIVQFPSCHEHGSWKSQQN